MTDAPESTHVADRLKISRPDSDKKFVHVIASHEDHLGNLIAEGMMPAEDYYPKLAEHYKNKLQKRAEELHAKTLSKNSATYRKLCWEAERLHLFKKQRKPA